MIFSKKSNPEIKKLYLGCAKPPFHKQHLEVLGDPHTWTWVDLYVKHPKIKNWDATKLSEVKNNSIEQIYASHLLEHFPQIEIKKILKIWFNKLEKGGKLILNVPDIVWAAEKIIEHDKGKKLKGYYTQFDEIHGLMTIIYGSQVHMGEYHKSGFSKKFLYKTLNEIGFRKVAIVQKVDAHEMGVLISTSEK